MYILKNYCSEFISRDRDNALFFIAGNCHSDRQCHPQAKCLLNHCACQGWHYGDGKRYCQGIKHLKRLLASSSGGVNEMMLRGTRWGLAL